MLIQVQRTAQASPLGQSLGLGMLKTARWMGLESPPGQSMVPAWPPRLWARLWARLWGPRMGTMWTAALWETVMGGWRERLLGKELAALSAPGLVAG